jgi:hypothetical protein
MNATRTLRLTAFASLLSVAVFAPQARALQAQAQSDDAAPARPETTAYLQDKPESKPADKNSAKAKPEEKEAPASFSLDQVMEKLRVGTQSDN